MTHSLDPQGDQRFPRQKLGARVSVKLDSGRHALWVRAQHTEGTDTGVLRHPRLRRVPPPPLSHRTYGSAAHSPFQAARPGAFSIDPRWTTADFLDAYSLNPTRHRKSLKRTFSSLHPLTTTPRHPYLTSPSLGRSVSSSHPARVQSPIWEGPSFLPSAPTHPEAPSDY